MMTKHHTVFDNSSNVDARSFLRQGFAGY